MTTSKIKILPKTKQDHNNEQVPLIFVDNILLFPGHVYPITAQDKIYNFCVQLAQQNIQRLCLVLNSQGQKKVKLGQKFVATEASISNFFKQDDGTHIVLLRGNTKAEVTTTHYTNEHFFALMSPISNIPMRATKANSALKSTLKILLVKMISRNSSIRQDIVAKLYNSDDPELIINLITPYLSVDIKQKIKIFNTYEIKSNVKKVVQLLARELELLQIAGKIQDEVLGDFNNNLKRNFLREQMIAIKKELGDTDDIQDELDELHTQIEELKLPKAIYETATKEIERMALMSAGSPEYVVSWNYVGWIKSLPWSLPSSSTKNIPARTLLGAKRILNSHHHGLDKIKQRILEYVAVLMHGGVEAVSNQILLLSGPPGVGKTSLGKAIAKTLKRPFARISLGGLKDEGEIRGHRRAYIGAMPGKIINAIKEAKSLTPVILLDEIDKVGGNNNEVTSALLEVLDPEQNQYFTDHYLNIPFDLSKVIFIATANNLHMIPTPLLDRMEVLELSGYTESEKIHIAVKHLLPFMRNKLKLSDKQFAISDEALHHLIRSYTLEAGVRQLNRALETIGRKVVTSVISRIKVSKKKITTKDLKSYLGVPKYIEEPRDTKLSAGVAIGLAYTSVGGDILYVESRYVQSRQRSNILTLTGCLGKVMQESAQTAFSFINSNAHKLSITAEILATKDIHLHLPDGATPKDGPSAGVSILCALVSLLQDKPLPITIAMTGEITLRGQVLAVGGIKEKVLAAHRYGKKTLILPKANMADATEIPKEVRKQLSIHFVSTMLEVLKIAGLLHKKPIPPATYDHKRKKNISYKIAARSHAL